MGKTIIHMCCLHFKPNVCVYVCNLKVSDIHSLVDSCFWWELLVAREGSSQVLYLRCQTFARLELTMHYILFKPHLNGSNAFRSHWSFTRSWFTADLYLFWHAHLRWPALLFRSLCSSKRHTCLDLNSSLFSFIAHPCCRNTMHVLWTHFAF